MRKLLVVFLFVINSISSPAQLQGANWVFGDSVGINFSQINPTLFQSSINSNECSASISDNAGNLLLYAGAGDDGFGNGYFYLSLWNRFHQKVIGGDSLYGQSSVTQGCLILPNPADTNEYFVFHINNIPFNGGGSLYYTKVNINANGGNGVIIQKNYFIEDSVTEKMAAVRHANGRDWWILIHKYGSSDFYKYLLTPSGIMSQLSQSVGASIDSGSADLGQMVFSFEGDKLALASYAGQMEFFDFDRCTGNLIHIISLGSFPYNRIDGFYGCSFSSNNNYLYASTQDSLFQFDLNATNIKASQKLIFVTTSQLEIIGQHLISLNEGKIYIALTNFQIDSLNEYLSIINLPEQPDTLCDFQSYNFSLYGRKQSLGLPNMPNYNLGRLIGSPCDTLTNITENNFSNTINIYPNPSSEKIRVRTSQKINSYKLTDAKGVTLKEEKIQALNNFELTIYGFKKGIYFLNIVTDKNSIVKKLVKE